MISRFSLLLFSALAAAPAFAAANTPVAVVSRLHMPVLHFPIALLIVALVIELLMRRRGDGHRSAVGALLVLAAAAAIVPAVSGLALERVEEAEGVVVERHEILGIATAVLASLAAIAYRSTAAFAGKVALPLMGLSAIAVMVASHLGGTLVHGADYFTKVFEPAGEKRVAASEPTRGSRDEDDGDAVARDRHPEGQVPDKPDYVTHIKPMFQRSCIKCHGAEKRKSGLRLDEKRFAMKGGESGASIVPGDPAKSLTYTMSALSADEEDVMPEKGKLLALSELETLKRWIEQGAVWPDDATTP